MMRKWNLAALAATHGRGVRHAEDLHAIVVSRRLRDEKPRTHLARRPSRPSLSLHLGNPQESQLPPGSTKTANQLGLLSTLHARANVRDKATFADILPSICDCPLWVQFADAPPRTLHRTSTQAAGRFLEVTMRTSHSLAFSEIAVICAVVLTVFDVSAEPCQTESPTGEHAETMPHDRTDYRKLLDRLRNDDANVRCRVLDELARSDDPSTWPDDVVDAIGQAMLSDSSREVRQQACGLLADGRYSPKRLEYLRKAMRSGDIDLQPDAVCGVGTFGEKAAPATEDILVLLDSKNADELVWVGLPYYLRTLRYFCVQALGNIGPPARRALPRLLPMVQKGNAYRLRIAAACAVIKISGGNSEALQVIVEGLSNTTGGESTAGLSASDIRLEAATALDSVGRLAQPALEILLKLYSKEENTAVRYHYLCAFGNVGVSDARIVKILKEALHSEGDFSTVKAVLGSLKSQGRLAREAMSEIRDVLLTRSDGARSVDIQKTAVRTMAAIAEPDAAVDVFCAKLGERDLDRDLLIDIVRQLGRYGPAAKKAAPVLRNLLKSCEGPTRGVVSGSLARIEGGK
jgi:HEAT repeat protein